MKTRLNTLFATLLLCCLGSLSAMAQNNVSVSGIVMDADLQEPLMGVTVVADGTTRGTVTGLDGRFTIEVPVGTTLRFSFVSFKTEQYKVTGANQNVRIVMHEDAQALDELVVLGYGASARKQDLSASVGIISNTDNLTSRPVTSATSMLQGQLAGVTVSNVGGDPTGMPNIVIRGQGSQNGDAVLWVVDGIPGAPITSVNDIESIVVLKDAASAAIYGAQSGAGGVVLVTTKKAKQGHPTLSYDGNFGVAQAYNVPTPLNAENQLKMRQLSYKNAGMSLPDSWDVKKNPWIGTTRTNWMDEIFRNAFYSRHNVSLNMGTDKSQNRIALSVEDNQGTLINTYSKKFAVRYNGSYEINDYITISEDLTWNNTRSRSKNTNDAYTGPILSAMYMPSSANVYNPADGSFAGVTTEDPAYIAKYGSNFADAHGDVVNPVRLLTGESVYNRTSDLWSTTSLTVGNVVPGLKFVSRFTYNVANNYFKNFRPRVDEPGKPDLRNSLREGAYRTDSWLAENTLTYDNTFGLHNVGALFSTTADHWQSRGVTGVGNDLSSEEKPLQYMANASSYNALDYLSGPDANLSFVGRLSWSYDDRYFATASWRRDYAGRLPKDNQYGDFPAVTAAWKLSNEGFFEKTKAFSLLKLRASWGRIGNLGSIPMNYSAPSMTSTYWDEAAVYGPESQIWYNTFYYYNKAINSHLTWETAEQLDLGLDLAFFGERLFVAMDYFDKRTYNLIQPQTMNWPNTIGLDPMLINQGEVRNRGFELSVNWNDQISKDLSYFVNGNFTYIKNWVSNIGVRNQDGTPGVWIDDNSKFRNIPYMIQTGEGQPLSTFYLIKTDGIFQTDEEAAKYIHNGKRIQPNAKAGDLKFVDANGDGAINDADRQYMGSAMAPITYAGTFGMTYKDFSFSAMLQGVQGAKALHVAKFMTLSDVEGNFNRDSHILDAWSPTNTGSNIPMLRKNDPNENFTTPSDFYLEDASYLRLKNVTLSYNMTNLLRGWGHLADRKSTMSLFVSGENLFTLTKYTGMDPEVGGWDPMRYPVSRIFSLGVKLTY